MTSQPSEQELEYYGEHLARNESGPLAVGYNSTHAQRIRFTEVARVLELVDEPFSILDVGCGIGGLVGFLAERHERFRYTGFDRMPEMIRRARAANSDPRATFVDSRDEVKVCDVAVASGIFNLQYDVPREDFQKWIHEELDFLARMSRRGFAFNMLTSHSDPDRMQAELHYADPAEVLDHCLRNFSRQVSVHHDYGLFDFTVVVNLEDLGSAGKAEVTLEPVGLQHADAMFRWLSDAEVAGPLGVLREVSPQRTREWIETAIRDPAIHAFAIVHAGRHVGNVVLDQVDPYLGIARFSIYVGERSDRGQGIGTAAVRQVLAIAFGELDLRKIWLVVHKNNTAGLTVYEHCGFVREGVLRDEFLLDGELCDAVRMAVFRDARER